MRKLIVEAKNATFLSLDPKGRIIIFSILLILLSSCGYTQSLNIIPQPVKEAITGKKYIIKNNSNIFIPSGSKELLRLAYYLKNELHNKTGLNLSIKKGKRKNGIVLSIDKKFSLMNSGYKLLVDSNCVKITSKSCSGIFYGIQTLREILCEDKEFYFPGCNVADFPRYSYRGFMLDASRHFQSVDFVNRILDIMSLLKLNVFHWHLTDNEGWRIESKRYPRLNTIGSYQDSLNSIERNGYYTIKEIKDIIKYARERYIKVVPEIEMPGHSKEVMQSYPYLLSPSDSSGITYCAGKERDYKFIENIIDEVIEIFKPDIIHVGGDERPKGVWEKDSLCQKMMRLKQITDEELLQNYFMKRICDYVSSKGVKTIAWAENIAGGIPQNQIIENYYPDISMEAARDNYYTINANCFYTYFDYPSSQEQKIKEHKPLWMPVLNLEKVYSFNPTPDSLEEEKRKYIIGTECALWTELVQQHDVSYQIFPRILAFAEDAWTQENEKNYEDFLKRVYILKPLINSIGFEFEQGKW